MPIRHLKRLGLLPFYFSLQPRHKQLLLSYGFADPLYGQSLRRPCQRFKDQRQGFRLPGMGIALCISLSCLHIVALAIVYISQVDAGLRQIVRIANFIETDSRLTEGAARRFQVARLDVP